MPAIRHALESITPSHLQTLVDEAWPEDEQLELKAAIPTKGGGTDRWARDQSGVDEYGRNQILEEVVAFANSYGGDVVLGVAETADKPPRAAGLEPLPQVTELAHRLELMARDCIEPPIGRLQARGIVLGPDGAGVVIIRVPRSRQAPHRLKPTRDCYRRSRDRTETMSMREIQDLTFSVARGLDAVDRRLTELRNLFITKCPFDPLPTTIHRLGICVRAVPATADLYLDRVHNVPDVQPQGHDFTLTFRGHGTEVIESLTRPASFRPILRGTCSVYSSGHFESSTYLYGDGALALFERFDSPVPDPGYKSEHALYTGWLLSLVLNGAAAADRVRMIAGATAVDYALEIEIVSQPNGVPILRLGARHPLHPPGHLPAGATLLPRYTLSGPSERIALLNLVWRDYWNAAGLDTETDEILAITHS